MFYYLKINNFLQCIESIDHNQCPICDSELNYDDQNDSVYISCVKNYNHFTISGFKNLGSGELDLLYLNNKNEGIINKTVLKEFQNVILRNLYGSFKK